MNDKELIRRALLGDKEAQEECTAKGIVLPCPFCGNEKNIISNWGMFRCWCSHCKAKSEDTLTQHDALKAWNSRPAPPIGRCGECAAYIDNKCSNTGYYKTEQGFCDDFEPREDKQCQD